MPGLQGSPQRGEPGDLATAARVSGVVPSAVLQYCIVLYMVLYN